MEITSGKASHLFQKDLDLTSIKNNGAEIGMYVIKVAK
jgi:hypothetical protein